MTMADTHRSESDAADRGAVPPAVSPAVNDLVSTLEAKGMIASVPPIPKPKRVEQLNNRRTLVLGLAGITMLVEILDIAGFTPGLKVGVVAGLRMLFNGAPATEKSSASTPPLRVVTPV